MKCCFCFCQNTYPDGTFLRNKLHLIHVFIYWQSEKLYIHLFDCCWRYSLSAVYGLMMNSDLKVETGSARWFREPMRVGSSLCVCWRMERWCQVEEKTAGCCCGTMITAKRAKLRWSGALVLTKQMKALLTFIMKSRHKFLMIAIYSPIWLLLLWCYHISSTEM